jgi:hypothetical protein
MTAPGARTGIGPRWPAPGEVGAPLERPVAVSAPVSFDPAVAVANAVLYEGYLLYPYRRSAGKNRMRWQFGVLVPRSWLGSDEGQSSPGVSGSADGWFQQAECLLETPSDVAVTLRLRLRFLQLTQRQVERRAASGEFEQVDHLDVGGAHVLSFDEARPHEIEVAVPLPDLLGPRPGAGEVVVEIPGGTDVEPLPAPPGTGTATARLVRRRWPVTARIRLAAARAAAPFRLYRVRARVENTIDDVAEELPRSAALRRSLIAAHLLLGVRAGRFLSLLDPPAWAAAATRDCENLRVQPVLAGASGANDVMLCSPIILYDHPQTAPESPGDLFDATEIDEILALRTRALTDDEKLEARATDPRAAEIIDRVDGLPPAILDRLHGAVRTLRPLAPDMTTAPGTAPPGGGGVSMGEAAWWDPEADRSVRPGEDSVPVAGTTVARGSRVRLRPHPQGTDAHDMFLAGRRARVEAVFLDVDGASHVAVTLDNEESGEMHSAAGRFLYFAPDELEPLELRRGAS